MTTTHLQPERRGEEAGARSRPRRAQTGSESEPVDLASHLQQGVGNRAIQAMRQANGSESADGAAAIARAGSESGGRSLDRATESEMSRRFGTDVAEVRVHTGPRAAASAAALGAEAYTIGSDVVFGAGNYRPRTQAGRELLAHELTHVRQRDAAGGRPTRPLSRPGDAAEREAERVASHLRGAEVPEYGLEGADEALSISHEAPAAVARQSDGEDGTPSPNVRMFSPPPIMWSGSNACPTAPAALHSVADQIWSQTQDELAPALQHLRELSGQASMAGHGAGFLDKALSKVGQYALLAVDTVMSIGQAATSNVANALSTDITRIRDTLVQARAFIDADSPVAARRLLDHAYGLLARNMLWLRFRDRRPGPEEFDVFDHCSSAGGSRASSAGTDNNEE